MIASTVDDAVGTMSVPHLKCLPIHFSSNSFHGRVIAALHAAAYTLYEQNLVLHISYAGILFRTRVGDTCYGRCDEIHRQRHFTIGEVWA